jgi:hypothetical protein
MSAKSIVDEAAIALSYPFFKKNEARMLMREVLATGQIFSIELSLRRLLSFVLQWGEDVDDGLDTSTPRSIGERLPPTPKAKGLARRFAKRDTKSAGTTPSFLPLLISLSSTLQSPLSYPLPTPPHFCISSSPFHTLPLSHSHSHSHTHTHPHTHTHTHPPTHIQRSPCASETSAAWTSSSSPCWPPPSTPSGCASTPC